MEGSGEFGGINPEEMESAASRAKKAEAEKKDGVEPLIAIPQKEPAQNTKENEVQQKLESNMDRYLGTFRDRPEFTDRDAEPSDIKFKPEHAIHGLLGILRADIKDHQAPEDTVEKGQLEALQETVSKISVNQGVSEAEWLDVTSYVKQKTMHWANEMQESSGQAARIAEANQSIFGSITTAMEKHKSLPKQDNSVAERDDPDDMKETPPEQPSQYAIDALNALKGKEKIGAADTAEYLEAVRRGYREDEQASGDAVLKQAVDAAKAYITTSRFKKFRARNKVITVTFNGNKPEVKLVRKSKRTASDPDNGKYVFTNSTDMSDTSSLAYAAYEANRSDARIANADQAIKALREFNSRDKTAVIAVEDAIAAIGPIDTHMQYLFKQGEEKVKDEMDVIVKMHSFIIDRTDKSEDEKLEKEILEDPEEDKAQVRVDDFDLSKTYSRSEIDEMDTSIFDEVPK